MVASPKKNCVPFCLQFSIGSPISVHTIVYRFYHPTILNVFASSENMFPILIAVFQFKLKQNGHLLPMSAVHLHNQMLSLKQYRQLCRFFA